SDQMQLPSTSVSPRPLSKRPQDRARNREHRSNAYAPAALSLSASSLEPRRRPMNITIPRRRLGAHLEVSAIGLACMGMSDFYCPTDEATNLEVLNHALDIGIDFLDTADIYGVGGANERLLSKVLKTRRGEVVLATKFGNVRSSKGEFLGIDGRP